jgi:hypothetical protein
VENGSRAGKRGPRWAPFHIDDITNGYGRLKLLREYDAIGDSGENRVVAEFSIPEQFMEIMR